MQKSMRTRLQAVSTSRIVGGAGLAVAIGLTLILVVAPTASAQAGFGPNAEVTRSDDTGKVIFVGTDPGAPIDAPAGISADSPAGQAGLTYLEDHADAFGIAGDELGITGTSSSQGGGTAIHTQQLVDGVPVLAGELVVNLTDDNQILSVSGEGLPVTGLDTDPAVDRDQAATAAIAAVSEQAGVREGELDAADPELSVYDPRLYGETGGTILAWSVQVYAPDSPEIVKQVLVDAHSGEAARINELVSEALNREVCDNNNARTATTDCSAPVLTEGGACSPSPCITDVQNIYDFSGQTYNFYNARWGRDSLNGAGMQLSGTARFCTNATVPNPSPPPPTLPKDPCPYNNAFFSPFTPATASQAFYGQAWTADDIVAHELTHGVTNFESALVYQNESGAMNESLSDVFGEAVDLVNGVGTDTAATRWQIGEDCTGAGCGVLRDMEAPPNFTDPDKMTSPNWKFWTIDNGGVHSNSGVNNKAMFLLTDGGAFNTYTVTAIGLEKAVRVYYEAQTNILTSGADYGALANALRQACTNITGTNGIVAADCTQVNNAVLATEMDTEALAPDTNIDSGPGQTDDPTPTWTFSSPNQCCQGFTTPNPEKPGLAGATYQCSVDQGTPNWAACSGPGRSHTPTSDLADGNYTFRVRGSIGTNTDPTPATRDFTVSTADMELVSKSDSQDPAFAGENLTYTITARNNGAGTAENAKVVDVLPSGTTYQSSSIPCSDSSGTLTCVAERAVGDDRIEVDARQCVQPGIETGYHHGRCARAGQAPGKERRLIGRLGDDQDPAAVEGNSGQGALADSARRQGQIDGEGAAATDHRARIDAPPHLRDEASGDGEAEAGSLVARAGAVRPCLNSSNRMGMRASGIPGPVSAIARTISRSTQRMVTPTPPRLVNLIALPARLTTIWRTRSASPTTSMGTSSATSMAISIPLSWARGARSSTTPSTTARTSNGSADRSRRPASIREKSRMPSMSVSKARPDVCTAST